MQAIILAAGMGKRLKELTSHATKCMVEVNGVSMIDRMLRQLDALHLDRIVMVVGYEGEKLIEYVASLRVHTPIRFVENKIYDKTNNIYSLYLARNLLIEDDTLLLESDLIFEDAVLEKIVADPEPNLALVAKYESWMDGTVVTIDSDRQILTFLSKRDFRYEDIKKYYKTVNIYKFSKEFSLTHYVPFLSAYVMCLGTNEYYEQVLKVITTLRDSQIKALPLDGESWYEIDDVQDLNIAESIFADEDEKLEKLLSRYGGYWRYPRLVDFCYLVNPFYPNQRLMDEIKASFEILLQQYPSGMEVNALLAAKYFGLKKEQVCVGNGAAELIKSLMEQLPGKLGVIYPTFEEYPNRRAAGDLVPFLPQNPSYSYTPEDLMAFYQDKGISALVLVNPDNPTGNFIPREGLIRLAHWADSQEITLIVDESFVDFADGKDNTLLHGALLEQCPRLIVLKSISKSFGVPGLRLGILASNQTALVAQMKKDVSIWNINSFGEYFLQIFEKYRSDYEEALEKFKVVRREYAQLLAAIPGLRLIPSQANYITFEVTGMSSRALARQLLSRYDLLVKDLSGKTGFDGKSYLRAAVKLPEENQRLANAIREILIQ